MTAELQGVPSVTLFGGLQLPQSVVVSWILIAALILAAILLTRNLSRDHPGKRQMALEIAVGWFNNFCRENIGEKHWKSFAPWLGTVGLYIAVANLSGFVGLPSPTRDLSVTCALAVMSMLLIYGAQFRYNGLLGGMKKFTEPVALLLPINLMEIVIRPLSLCMRLFGNVMASYIIMEMIKCLVPVLLPIPFSLYFDLFDGLIQTLVFVFLTSLFVGEAVEDEEE